MKIAYIVSSKANAGPVNVVRDLVKAMITHGHDVEVFYFSEEGVDDFGCPVHKLTMKGGLKWNDYDVVHTHGGRPDLYVLIHKPLRWKGRCFTTIHSFIFEDHKYKYGRFLSQFTTRAILMLTSRHDKVIVLGRTALEYYKNRISEKRLLAAYNTRTYTEAPISDADALLITQFKAKYPQIIGTACCITKRKALEQVVKAMKLMPEVGFVVLGDGPEKSALMELGKTIGVDSQILFLGQRPHADRFLPYFDIFVIPSRSEGFPLAMLEAASAGIAIVSSDIPVFNEFFSDDEVVKFPVDDIVKLKDSIIYAIEQRAFLGDKIKKRYLKDYSPEMFYKRHIDIYSKADVSSAPLQN